MTNQYVDLKQVLANIQSHLDGGGAVGYAGVIGANGETPIPFASGPAQQEPGQTPIPYSTATKSQTASVSKFITGLAAVAILDANPNATHLDDLIWKHLPSDWQSKVGDAVKQITFRHLLSHTSGLPAEGAKDEPSLDFASIFTYLARLNPAPTGVGGSPTYAGHPAYSNFGFALMRILLPVVVTPNDPRWTGPEAPKELADEYVRLVNEYVFSKVGVTGVDTKVTSSGDLAITYVSKPWTTPGWDWMECIPALSLASGASGWFVSVDDMQPVLASLALGDSKILTPLQWDHMQGSGTGVPAYASGLGLGIDVLTDTTPPAYRWVEKNGGFGYGWMGHAGVLTSSVAFFGSKTMDTPISNAPLYGALFINSDIAYGTASRGGWFVCSACAALYDASVTDGVCPVAGSKGHTKWGEYALAQDNPDGPSESDWRVCTYCNGVVYAPGGATTTGACPDSDGDGPHTCAGGSPWVLPTALGDDAIADQGGWRRCADCAAVYSIDTAGVCGKPGGGAHTDSGPTYVLHEPIGADSVLLHAFRSAVMTRPIVPPGGGHPGGVGGHPGGTGATGGTTGVHRQM